MNGNRIRFRVLHLILLQLACATTIASYCYVEKEYSNGPLATLFVLTIYFAIVTLTLGFAVLVLVTGYRIGASFTAILGTTVILCTCWQLGENYEFGRPVKLSTIVVGPTLVGGIVALIGGLLVWVFRKGRASECDPSTTPRPWAFRVGLWAAYLGIIAVAWSCEPLRWNRKSVVLIMCSDCTEGEEHWEFWGGGLVDADLAAWFDTVDKQKDLQLSFHYTSVGDEGVEVIVELPNVMRVDLRGTLSTRSGVESFRRAHPRCTVIAACD